MPQAEKAKDDGNVKKILDCNGKVAFELGCISSRVTLNEINKERNKELNKQYVEWVTQVSAEAEKFIGLFDE